MGGARSTHHDEATDAQEEEHAPLLQISRQQEPHTGQSEHHHSADERAPSSEVIYTHQRVRSLPYPTYSRVSSSRAQHAQHSNAYSTSTLRRGNAVVAGSTVGWARHRAVIDDRRDVSVSASRRSRTASREECGRFCNQDDTEQRDECGDLLHASKRLSNEVRASPAGQTGGEEGNDCSIC